MDLTNLCRRGWSPGWRRDGAAPGARRASLIPPHGEKRVQTQPRRTAIRHQIEGRLPIDATKTGVGRHGQPWNRRDRWPFNTRREIRRRRGIRWRRRDTSAVRGKAGIFRWIAAASARRRVAVLRSAPNCLAGAGAHHACRRDAAEAERQHTVGDREHRRGSRRR